MASTEKLQEIAAQFKPDQNVIVGKWFGKPCLAIGKKVFVVLWGRDLAFKLNEEAVSQALQIEGAHLFDPRGKGNPMKQWVQIPADQSSVWGRFAELAYQYVSASLQK